MHHSLKRTAMDCGQYMRHCITPFITKKIADYNQEYRLNEPAGQYGCNIVLSYYKEYIIEDYVLLILCKSRPAKFCSNTLIGQQQT